MNVKIILFLCSDQIHLINSFQNLIFITFLVKYSVSKLGNKAWETRNIRICAMPYSLMSFIIKIPNDLHLSITFEGLSRQNTMMVQRQQNLRKYLKEIIHRFMMKKWTYMVNDIYHWKPYPILMSYYPSLVLPQPAFGFSAFLK